jgi:hypothetical protein
MHCPDCSRVVEDDKIFHLRCSCFRLPKMIVQCYIFIQGFIILIVKENKNVRVYFKEEWLVEADVMCI